MCLSGALPASETVGYTVPRNEPERPDGKRRDSSASAESIAFLLLAGIVLGAAAGAGLDWLLKTFPLCMIFGVFAGFALALYAVYLETK
jgi:F0F1-type ATP synthase assembly protein I